MSDFEAFFGGFSCTFSIEVRETCTSIENTRGYKRLSQKDTGKSLKCVADGKMLLAKSAMR